MKLPKHPETLLLAIALPVLLTACSTPREPASAAATAAIEPASVPSVPTPPAPSVPTPPKPPTAKSDFDTIQGTWKGQEIGGDEGAATLTISGKNLEVRGSNPNDWYKGTFVLREDTNPKQCIFSVTECAAPDYVGKVSHAIYSIENGALTIAGNEPGNPEPPSAFDADGARRFRFKLQ
jgi:uncharacterized protein (TIGR03067 family)